MSRYLLNDFLTAVEPQRTLPVTHKESTDTLRMAMSYRSYSLPLA